MVGLMVAMRVSKKAAYSDVKKAAYSDVMTGQKLVVNLADY